ncbi:MAG: hypothetical protein E7039_07740 [Lentisphaerae bacterium]|nr:hypothetical protein [Lentisphaerota bacterium]
MKKIIMLAVAVFGVATLFSSENAVKNGTFDQLVAGKPAAWIVKNTTGITFSGDGAPESGFVKFDLVKEGKKASATIWQSINKVVKSNAQYNLSFKLRTSSFRGNIRVIAINDGWQKGSGLVVGGRFPADWKEYKKVITMPEFKKDARLLVMITATKGTVDVADVKLEPVK